VQLKVNQVASMAVKKDDKMNKKSMPGYKDGGSAAKSRGGPKSNNCGLFGRVQGKMNGGAMQPMGGRQNLANEETNRPNFGRDTTNYQYRNASKDMGRAAPMKPPGGMKGGGMVNIRNKKKR